MSGSAQTSGPTRLYPGPTPLSAPWPMNQKCTPSSIDHIIKNAQFDDGAVPSVFIKLTLKAWILGISPGIFLLVVIKWSPTHLKILDSNGMDPTLWVNSSLRSPISQSGLTSPPTKSIEPRDPANLGLPSCCEKSHAYFFKRRELMEQMYLCIFIYIHLYTVCLHNKLYIRTHVYANLQCET